MNASRPAEDVARIIVERAEQQRPCVLATILWARGSTPLPAGAQAVVEPDGSLLGTVGGGPFEAEVRRRALEALEGGAPAVFEAEFTGDDAAGSQPVCGGRLRVLVDPTAARHHAAYQAACRARQNHGRGILLTTIHHSAPPNLSVEFLAEAELAAAPAFMDTDSLRRVLEQDTPEWFVREASQDTPRREVLAQPVLARPVLLIAGGGHVGQAVAQQAAPLGFDIVVADDRPEFARSDRFPAGTDARCAPIAETVGSFPTGPDTYIVIVTRGHQHDAATLERCLRSPAAYLGMIGSRRKVALLRQEFLDSGRATAAEFDRVYAPIGLDLGAVTVPEIAVSIVAQLIAVRRRGHASRIALAPYAP